MAQKWFLGVLKPAEHELGNENSCDVELRVYRSIFRKISTLPVELEISYLGFFDVMNPKKFMKKSFPGQWSKFEYF